MTMRYLERELRATGDPRDKNVADVISAMHKTRGNDIDLPQLAPLAESKVATEQLTLREKFTDAERKALIADGAVIYLPLGETIPVQKEAQAKKGKLAFRYVVNARNYLRAVPSRQVEVAIYPAVDRFFVSGSFGKGVGQQEELVA